MNEIVESFKRSLIEDGKSPKTIESYIGDIKAFIEFLGDKGVEFNGNLQRFYIVSYKNFLVENNYFEAMIKDECIIRKSFDGEFIGIDILKKES
ncbi:hypothetical protein [uncultured Clostridium sp.]|uniref:hypothetical protein n=1 Tax=uncultured Clostridium sp. TaxID=59620 RepID=UPI0025F26970|nr:hypothetical protein [uncultured Clostridium sp.]